VESTPVLFYIIIIDKEEEAVPQQSTHQTPIILTFYSVLKMSIVEGNKINKIEYQRAGSNIYFKKKIGISNYHEANCKT